MDYSVFIAMIIVYIILFFVNLILLIQGISYLTRMGWFYRKYHQKNPDDKRVKVNGIILTTCGSFVMAISLFTILNVIFTLNRL